MTTSAIISQRQTLVAVPPQLRRGRHSVARVHGQPPNRIELLNLRVAAARAQLNERSARFVADRTRPEHLDLVRARVARWSAIAVPVAAYVAVVLGALVR